MSRRDGLIDLTAHGSPHKLQFTVNAMCEFEDLFDRSFFAFLSEFHAAGENITIREVRRMLWVGLIEHHEGITEQEAGRVAQAIGGLSVAGDLLGAALQAAMPDAGEDDADPEVEDRDAGKSQAA